jgi:hypothetical protein
MRTSLKKVTTEMSRVLAEHGTRLTELDGIGPVVAARLLGRTGHAGRFVSASAFGLDRPGRAHPGEHLGSCGRGQVGARATRHKVPEQGVELVDRAGALRDQVPASLAEQGQHRAQVLRAGRVGLSGQQRDAGGRRGVDDVVLAPPTPRQFPHPSGRGRRNIMDGLPASEQPLREVAAQTAGVLHRPPSLRERRRPAQQPPVARERGVDLHAGHHPVRAGLESAGGVAALVGVDPDDDHVRVPLVDDRGETADDMPTSSAEAPDTPLPESDHGPEHRPVRPTPAQPARRRQAIHESDRPVLHSGP